MLCNKLLELKRKMGGEFLRFVVVGVAATLLHLLCYIGLNKIFGLTQENELGLNISYTTGYIISFFGNYILSLKWTFKTEGSVGKGLGFAFSHAVNYGLHMLLLNLFLLLGVGQALASLCQRLLPSLVEVFPFLGDGDSWLPIPVFCIVIPVNFLLVRFFLKR